MTVKPEIVEAVNIITPARCPRCGGLPRLEVFFFPPDYDGDGPIRVRLEHASCVGAMGTYSAENGDDLLELLNSIMGEWNARYSTPSSETSNEE